MRKAGRGVKKNITWEQAMGGTECWDNWGKKEKVVIRPWGTGQWKGKEKRAGGARPKLSRPLTKLRD